METSQQRVSQITVISTLQRLKVISDEDVQEVANRTFLGVLLRLRVEITLFKMYYHLDPLRGITSSFIPTVYYMAPSWIKEIRMQIINTYKYNVGRFKSSGT